MTRTVSCGLLLLSGVSACNNSFLPEDWPRRLMEVQEERVGIVHGSVVSREEMKSYPWMIAQGRVSAYGDAVHCGGTLIAPQWVLTAAHCLYSYDDWQATAWVDFNRYEALDSSDPTVERRNLTWWGAHPQWDKKTSFWDVALLKLDQPVTNTPITLDLESKAADPGDSNFVVGWGSLDEGCTKYPSVPYKGTFPITTDEVCEKATTTAFYNPPVTMCAGYANGKIEVGCADSGGPLIAQTSTGFVQTGIVSWGNGFTYDVFTRVGAVKDWIFETMKAN